jgi:hypothetical protein
MVAAVEQRDVDRELCQGQGGVKPAKTTSYDDDSGAVTLLLP